MPAGREVPHRGTSAAGDPNVSEPFQEAVKAFEEGQACENVLLVTRGVIRVYKISPSGREITLYLVQPGEMCILGISCLLSDARYPARAEVRTHTEALGIPAAAFRRMDERLAVFLLKEAERVPGTWEPVATSHERMDAYMEKDKSAVKTGGWVYAAYGPDGSAKAIDPVKDCYECHAGRAKATDFVFHKYID